MSEIESHYEIFDIIGLCLGELPSILFQSTTAMAVQSFEFLDPFYIFQFKSVCATYLTTIDDSD